MNPENCLLDLQDAGDAVKKIIIRVVTILHVKYDKKGKHVQTKSHRYGLTPHQTDRRQYTIHTTVESVELDPPVFTWIPPLFCQPS